MEFKSPVGRQASWRRVMMHLVFKLSAMSEEVAGKQKNKKNKKNMPDPEELAHLWAQHA